MEKGQTLEISFNTILKVFLAIFIFYLIYLVREIALWFLFGLAIAVLLEPAIKILRRVRIPKILAIVIVYFSIFGILGLALYLSAPIFMAEIRQFAQNLPDYFNQINPFLQRAGIDIGSNFGELTGMLTDNLAQSSKSLINALMVFFGGLTSTAFILTIAFFLSLEDNGPEKFISLVTPKKYEERIAFLFERSQTTVAGWFGARVLACLFVGIASFIVFYIFGIKYALILAFISGVLNFIPYIGPLITSILLIVFVAVFSESWIAVVYILIAITIIQEIENKLLTPILMKKIIDIPPVLVLVSLLAGSKIFGFLGAIFAVPVFGIIYEFIKEILEKRREDVVSD
jgi:predicted PurR-regulated permease PerM